MSTKPPANKKRVFSKFRHRVYPFFWFIAAADETLLRDCTVPEQDKQAGIGMSILCTTIAAIISSYYAVYSLFANWRTALLLAIFWGVIIFNLDRFMVGSIRKDRQRRLWKEIKVAIPRIILAFFIAILISKPLEVKIFQNQIQEAKSSFSDSLQARKFTFESAELLKEQGQSKVARNDFNQVNQESKDLTLDAAYLQFKTAYDECLDEKGKLESRLEVRRRQRQIAFNNDNQSEVRRLRTEMQKLRKQINELGCPGKKKLMDERATAYTQSQLKRVAVAQQRLDQINANADSAAAILREKRKDAGVAIDNATKDILGQLRILKSLKEKDKGMWLASLLITGLFFILETAPVLVKILSPRGEYDTLLAIAEKQAFDNEEAANEESGQRTIARKKAAGDNTTQLGEIDEKVKQQVQEKILNAQADLAEKIVEAWKQQEESELRDNRTEYLKHIITKSS